MKPKMLRLTSLYIQLAVAIVLFGVLQPGWAASDLTGIRTWTSPENTRVVFDVQNRVDYKVFTLDNPGRVVIDLANTVIATPIPDFSNKNHHVIKSIRAGMQKSNDLRVVLDVASDNVKWRSYLLEPTDGYGYRVVLELDHDVVSDSTPLTNTKTESKKTEQEKQEPRQIVVAIDAGHGGEDPGARGSHGTYEKEVVLRIARQLEAQLKRDVRFKPVLVRDGDYYVSLRKRSLKAREHKADLFVSIHADAFKNPKVQGSSVFILSPKGGSDEAARWLAEKENASDLIGGVSLEDKDDVLASVLLDLSMTGTIDASGQAAKNVLDEIKRVGPVHNDTVQSARFVVLKSPDIPSMLIETAFISNPREERRLKDPRYQLHLAQAITSGITSYFQSNPPPGTMLAFDNQRHIIQAGETLSVIADRYRVNLTRLIAENRLQGDLVRVGQTLRIPTTRF